MAAKNDTLMLQMEALKVTDLTLLIRLIGLIVPRVIDVYFEKLSKKQRKALYKIMPVGGKKKIYIQLVGTPTLPIVIHRAMPIMVTSMNGSEIKKQKIRGIKLTVEDLQLVAKGLSAGNMLKLVWRLKGQMFTLLYLSGIFLPLITLGPAELKDLLNRTMTHFQPLLELPPFSRMLRESGLYHR